jgi:5-methylcytosine-specific restriction endonuclease McrA
MLRRAENVHASHRDGVFTGKGPILLHIGREIHVIPGKIKKQAYGILVSRSGRYPTLFGRIGERNYWLFAGRWYWDNDDLVAEQVYALLVTRQQRNQAQINRAQSMVAMAQVPAPARRGAIADDVKQLVWTRDQGRCRQCGSNVELQFDHIIPVAYGGASTSENLQILCGPCNRRKGASVV